MEMEHARRKVLSLWKVEKRSWRYDDYTTFFQVLKSFYDKLERDNAELLSFKYLGDKWQVVNKWIQDYEKHTNC